MIELSDLQIDVWRSRDATGASERVVRVTHLPTGVCATAQGGASESEDRATAIAEVEETLGELHN